MCGHGGTRRGRRRSCSLAALTIDEQPESAPAEVAAAKLFAGAAALANAAANIQNLGAIGFTYEHDAHLYLKRARVLDTLWGDGRSLRSLLLERSPISGGHLIDEARTIMSPMTRGVGRGDVPRAPFHGLEALLEPSAVAIIGASDQVDSIGGRILDHIKTSFRGAVLPINPKRKEIQGLPTCPSIDCVEHDLAGALVLVAVRSELVCEVLAQCAARDVGAAIVFSSGFAEIGGAGREMQDELGAVVRSSKMRLLGPNCLGLINVRAGLRATFMTVSFGERDGAVALIGQSGAFGFGVYELMLDEGLGVSVWAATGNESDISAGELAGYLMEQDGIDVVAAMIEGINRPDLLLAAGRRGVELGKPLIVLKAGGSAAGARAAARHTGAEPVSSEAFAAAAESAGIVEVPDARSLIDTVKAFVPGRLPAGRRAVVLSGSGGVGVMMADAAEAAGLTLPQPDQELERTLTERIPPFGSVANPIDYTGQVVNDQSKLAEIIQAVSDSDLYDIVVLASLPRTLGDSFRELVVNGALLTPKPCLVRAHQDDVRRLVVEAGVAAIDDPHACIRAAAALAQFAEARERACEASEELPNAEPRLPRHGAALVGYRARRLLAAYGVPVIDERIVANADEAIAAARAMGASVTMALLSPSLADTVGEEGVRTDLDGEDRIRAAFAELETCGRRPNCSEPERGSIVVQEVVPSGIALVVGVHRDRTFGPIVSVGARRWSDQLDPAPAMALVPFSRAHARRLVDRLWERRGDGGPVRAVEALAAAIHAVGCLALWEPGVAEARIDPLVVAGDRVVAVGARVSFPEENHRLDVKSNHWLVDIVRRPGLFCSPVGVSGSGQTLRSARVVRGSRMRPRSALMSPVQVWAAAGGVILCFELAVLVRWVSGPYFKRVPAGPTAEPGWMRLVGDVWQPAGVLAVLLCVYWCLVRPWLRDRNVTFDGLLVLALATLWFEDPMANYFGQWYTYNANLINFGSWVKDVPGWQAYGRPERCCSSRSCWSRASTSTSFCSGQCSAAR